MRRPSSTKFPDGNKNWWLKMPGLPGEATRTPRKCPVCGAAYYRTHCPNSRCRIDGEAPETRAIAARAPRIVLEPDRPEPVDAGANHLAIEALNGRQSTRRQPRSSVPLSKRESMPAAATSHKRYSMNRME